jgi:mono/diheme cytochrome c family protein
MVAAFVLVLILAACGGQAEPTPTKTPRPSDTPTALPTLAAAALPLVESGATAPVSTDTPVATGEQVSPLSPMSPLATPEPTPAPEPTATPGLEAQPPVPVLAASLSCGEGCNAGNPAGVGMAILVPETGQFNVWVTGLDPLENEEYEGWLVLGDQVESSGRFNVEADGTGSTFGAIDFDVKDLPWEEFVLTIEPEPDDSDDPATPHSIGGPFRNTVIGEALYSRFDMTCQQCHGLAAEGGDGPVLAGTSLPFADFVTAVRSHEGLAQEDDVSTRDLQHMYAWLISGQP